jgi:hypothetical protein
MNDSLVKQIAIYLLLPVVTAVAGGVVTAWWIGNHPETEVHYLARTTSIPARAEMKFDTFSEVAVWNPSKRVRATSVHVTMDIPTATECEIGDLKTAEDSSTVDVGVLQKRVGYKTIEVRAARLAPGADVVLGIWWRSAGTRAVEVRGTADQCVLTQEDTVPGAGLTVGRDFLMIIAMIIASVAAAGGIMASTTMSALSALRKARGADVVRTADLGTIVDNWSDVIARLRTGGKTAEAAFLSNALPITLSEGDGVPRTLRLRFQNEFHYQQMTPKRLEVVAEVIESVFGVRVVVDRGAPPPAPLRNQ